MPASNLPIRNDYNPLPCWAGGHRMTVYAWARPRRFPALPPPRPRLFDVGSDTRVLAHCYWQREPGEHPTLVAFHGLEGSSSAHYMRGLADKALRQGFNAVLLNQRNCGGTEHLTPALYHSGLTADPAAVIRELVERDRLPSIAVVGYSLGGNLALKLAGEYGAEAPPAVRAVCAVSPTLDLAASATMLERRQNILYQWYFVRSLKRRMRRKHRLFPDRYRLDDLGRITSIRAFDDRYTAPHHGYRDAADYYVRASAARVVDRIRIPALILTAGDDPLVPVDPVRTPEIQGNPWVTVVVTRHGGHCGFLGTRKDGDDGYWAERMAVRFAGAHAAGPDQADCRLTGPTPGTVRGSTAACGRTRGPCLPPRA